MSTRFADMFRPRASRRSDGRALFMAGGVAASLFLLGVVLQSVVPKDGGMLPRVAAPDFSTLLPAGAALSGPTVELPDLPQPAYIVSYAAHDAGGLLLVEWDREDAAYAARTALSLTDDAGTTGLARVDALTMQPMGAGADVLLARGPFGDDDAIVLVARRGHELALVRSVETVDAWSSVFLVPAASAGTTQLSFEDADGDGRKEAVFSSTMTDEEEGVVSSTKVYRWDGTILAFDAELSRILSMSRALFPEPAATE